MFGGIQPLTISKSLIEGNYAYDSGGIDAGSMLNLINVILIHNTSDVNGGGITVYNQVNIVNSIFWNNSPVSVNNVWGNLNIKFSNIEGGWEGETNINEESIFIDPENGDFSLQANSPCIDAGTADFDGDGIEDISEYFGFAPDIGLYEFVTDCSVPYDTNSDGEVNILDVIEVVNYILDGNDLLCSIFEDGEINILEIIVMVNIILEGE